MMKINYIHKLLLSERNTCLGNLIILHPPPPKKKKRNIPPNLPSTHLSIAHNYLSVLKTDE